MKQMAFYGGFKGFGKGKARAGPSVGWRHVGFHFHHWRVPWLEADWYIEDATELRVVGWFPAACGWLISMNFTVTSNQPNWRDFWRITPPPNEFFFWFKIGTWDDLGWPGHDAGNAPGLHEGQRSTSRSITEGRSWMGLVLPWDLRIWCVGRWHALMLDSNIFWIQTICLAEWMLGFDSDGLLDQFQIELTPTNSEYPMRPARSRSISYAVYMINKYKYKWYMY